MSEQEMQICDNCMKSFPESKIATHFGYCRRNIKKCEKCGEMYDINFVEEHEEEFHKMSSCKYCQKSFKPNEITRHESTCDARTQFCEYCDLDVPLKSYPAHLKQCESRTKQCEKCRKPIANKDFIIHTISCPGIVEEPVISYPTPKYSNYDQYLKQNQKKQVRRQEVRRQDIHRVQEKKYEYKPSVMDPKRQPSRGFQRQRKPQINYLNSRPTEIKKDQVVQPSYKSPITSVQQPKPAQNYLDMKNLPINGDKRVPNIGQKDKYGRIQYGNRIADSNKNVGSGKIIQNKYVASSRTNNVEYQPSSMNYGVRKASNEPISKVSQPVTVNSRNTKPSVNYIPSRIPQQPNILSNKQINLKRQVQKARQPEQKKQFNYGDYMSDYQNQDQLYNFKKQDTRANQQLSRSRPNQPYYLPTGPQSRTYERPRVQQPSYNIPEQNAYIGSSSLGVHDEDEEIQKAIMASLSGMNINTSSNSYQKPSSTNQKYKIDEVPADLLQNDMLNQSFYDKQFALMQEIEKNKKRR